MNKEINLLSGERKKAIHEHQTPRRAKIIAIIFLTVVVILSLVSFYLNKRSQVVTLDQQNRIDLAQVSLSQQKIISLFLVEDRIHKIDDIQKTHSSFSKILSDITVSLPADVSINSFSINQKKLSVTYSSPSLLSLQTVISSAEDMLKKKFFKQITVNGLIAEPKAAAYILVIDADVI